MDKQRDRASRNPRDLGDTTYLGEWLVPKNTESEAQHVLTVVAGRQAGRTVGLSGGKITAGREPDCDIALLGRGISRVHFELEFIDDGTWAIVDCGSRNGTFVNGERVERRRLVYDDTIQIGLETALKYSFGDKADIAVRVANYEESIRDPLTCLYNRRHFMLQLTYQTHNALRRRKPMSVLLFDIDRFKSVNDKYGHPVGDVVIKRISDCVVDTIRPEDIVCRYGGEEFAVILAGTDARDAYVAAERIRFRISRLRFRVEGEYLTVTASFGVASLCVDETMQMKELMQQADKNLYRAKEGGRNRTVGGYREGADAKRRLRSSST